MSSRVLESEPTPSARVPLSTGSAPVVSASPGVDAELPDTRDLTLASDQPRVHPTRDHNLIGAGIRPGQLGRHAAGGGGAKPGSVIGAMPGISMTPGCGPAGSVGSSTGPGGGPSAGEAPGDGGADVAVGGGSALDGAGAGLEAVGEGPGDPWVIGVRGSPYTGGGGGAVTGGGGGGGGGGAVAVGGGGGGGEAKAGVEVEVEVRRAPGHRATCP